MYCWMRWFAKVLYRQGFVFLWESYSLTGLASLLSRYLDGASFDSSGLATLLSDNTLDALE